MLYHTTTGTRDNPPLLFLHGFLGSHADFLHLLPTLSKHFYCVTVDLPGHGKTETKLGDYTFSRTAEAIVDLLDYLNIRKTHVLGYSLGGRIALYLACEFGDRIADLIIESVSPGLKTAAERKQRQQQDDITALELLKTPLLDFLDKWYSNPLFADLKQHPKLFADMVQRRLQNRPEELARALCGLSLGRQPPLWEHVSTSRSPLLILVGVLDPKFVSIGTELFEYCQTNNKQATLSVFERCGHNIHLIAPNAYVNAIVKFIHQTR